MRTLTLAIFAILLVAAAGTALAEDKNGRRDDDARDKVREHLEAREDGSGKLLLHNDKIAVWFHLGKNHAKPDLRVAINGSDGNKSGYRVQILRILEIPQNSTEPVRGHFARMNLAKMDDWNVQQERTNDSITLTMVHAEAQGIVTLVWHIDTVNDTVKFDTKIDNWRWANASDRLVLDMLVIGHNLRNETGAKISVEGAGYISWADSATVQDPGANGTRTIPVVAVTKSLRESRDEGDDDRHESNSEHESSDEARERDGNKGGHVFLVFNGTGGYKTLDYDPTFGVASVSTNPVPGVGPIVGVVAIGALAALVARRRSA